MPNLLLMIIISYEISKNIYVVWRTVYYYYGLNNSFNVAGFLNDRDTDVLFIAAQIDNTDTKVSQSALLFILDVWYSQHIFQKEG